jgi:hypothetical protein
MIKEYILDAGVHMKSGFAALLIFFSTYAFSCEPNVLSDRRTPRAQVRAAFNENDLVIIAAVTDKELGNSGILVDERIEFEGLDTYKGDS